MTYAAQLFITANTAWSTWYEFSDRACHDTAKVYRWYVATFFSAKAQQRYQWIGEMLGCLIALAVLYTQRWAEAEVQSCIAQPAPQLVEADPFDQPQALAAVAAAMAPVATQTVKVSPAKRRITKTQRLRKECSAKGIQWRNAHGTKHMSNAEMEAALLAHA
jgi:hypothetical protein